MPRPTPKFQYPVPINEAEVGGTITMLVVTIQDESPVRRGAKLRRIFRNNYGLTRQQAKDALRAMEFTTVVT